MCSQFTHAWWNVCTILHYSIITEPWKVSDILFIYKKVIVLTLHFQDNIYPRNNKSASVYLSQLRLKYKYDESRPLHNLGIVLTVV